VPEASEEVLGFFLFGLGVALGSEEAIEESLSVVTDFFLREVFPLEEELSAFPEDLDPPLISLRMSSTSLALTEGATTHKDAAQRARLMMLVFFIVVFLVWLTGFYVFRGLNKFAKC